jgi:uncharacterized membrane protein
MKGLVAGLLFWALFAAAVPWGAPLGLIAGAVVAYVIWRLDAFDRRLKKLERGDVVQATPLLADAEPDDLVAGSSAVPPDLRAPMPPADESRPSAEPVPPPLAVAAETPAAAAKSPPLISMTDLEALLAGRLLAIVGGLALLIGGVFFMGLAFSRGWIGPEARSALGVVVGALLYASGAWFLLRPGNRTREILAHVLVAVGLAVVTLGLFAATRLYGFVAPEFGVGAALLAAAVAAAIAIRARSQLVAGFGLVAVLAAPPVMGASATLLTIVFLGAALAGTTAICLYTSWRWLPPAAFLLAVPQLASYILGDPNRAIGLVAVVAFWAMNALSAAGEEIRRPSQRLSETSATLMVANSAFAVWAGFMLMSGPFEPWRGLYLVGVAAAHLAVGSYFLLRNGELHPFGMLVFGSGIASLTLAVPVQLGASWVPMAWAAEAVALTWVYAQRHHLYAGAVAVVLGTLALGHLLFIEYSVGEVSRGQIAGAVPFLNASGSALAFTTVAAGVAIYLLRRPAERVGVAGIMAGAIAFVLPRELGGVAVVAACAGLVAGPLLVERRWLGIPLSVDRAVLPDWRTWTVAIGERLLYASAAIAGLIGLRFVFRDHLPPGDFASGLSAFASFARPPFFDEGTLVAAIVVTAALVVAFGAGDRMFQWFGCLAAALTVAYLVPSEVGSAWSVVAWLGLGLALHLLATRWHVADLLRLVPTYAFGIAVAFETLLVVAAPDRLVVRTSAFPEAAVFNGGMLAVAALAAVLGARAWLPPSDRDAKLAGLLAGASAVYLLSIGTVDLFQAAVGGGSAFDDLHKQAQVALSVLWAVLGVAGFVVGLVRQSAIARLFGLGLLAIVTAKVFIVDLAALDVAYRVLSFVALGLLLLGAAYLASRFQPDRATDSRPMPPSPPVDPPATDGEGQRD